MVAKKTAKKVAPKKSVAKKSFEAIEEESSESSEVNAFERNRRSEVLAAVSGIKVDETIKKLTDVNLSVGRTLSDVQQQIIEKVGELEEINEAIELKNIELQTIYDKEVVLKETTDLLYAHRQLEKEHEEQRAAWTKNFQEESAEKLRERARNEEQYKFNQNVERRNIENKFADEDRIRTTQNAVKQGELERNWAQREAELKAKENDFANYKAQVEAFPTKLDAEVKKEVAIATSSVKRDLTHQFALEKKDLETQLQVANQNNVAAQRSINSLETEVERLRTALEAANQKIVDVANGAFASVSGQAALGALQNFGNGQAQSKPTGKA